MKKFIAILLIALCVVIPTFASSTDVKTVKVPSVKVVEVNTSEQNKNINDTYSPDNQNEKKVGVGIVDVENTINDAIIRNAPYISKTDIKVKNEKPVKLIWSLGLNMFFPVKKEWRDDVMKEFSLSPEATFGMLIKDVAYLAIGVNPMFAETKTRSLNPDGTYTTSGLKMAYECTNLEVNLGAKFAWGETDTLVAFAVGTDADRFKSLYIMPNVSLGFQKLGVFEPVFNSINVVIGGKYEIFSKVWEIKFGLSLSGLY